MLIRIANSSDAESLVELLKQLGYPSTATTIAARFVRVEGRTDYRAWVALDDDQGVLGFIAGHVLLPYEADDPILKVMILVVNDRVRRGGLGRRLIAAVETWGQSQDARRAIVSSALYREDAHAFYESVGYVHTSKHLGKTLTPDES